MTADANSVNMESRNRYHHGDLRSALIAAGMAALESAPVEDLSLRALARQVGVSATAVYRHFPDKQSLLVALAQAAIDRMAAAQMAAAQAAAQADDPAAAFRASGAAYVRFAISHPDIFRLIWRVRPSADLLALPLDQVHPAMRSLRQSVAALLPAGATAAAHRVAALRCWSVVHGLALLILDGHTRVDDAMIDAVVGDLVRTLGD